MNFFYDKNSKSFRTKPLYTFIFCLIFIVVPGVVLWLLYGYIDFSDSFFIFPAYGIIANGTKQEIIHHLTQVANNKNIYFLISEAVNELLHTTQIQNWTGTGTVYLANYPWSYISPMICAIILPYIVWSLIIPIPFKFTKLINYDVISFSFTCAGVFSVLIISGAIPVASSNGSTFNYFGQWIILARIIIAIFSAILFFIIANRIVIVCLNVSKTQNDYYMQLTNETLEVQKKEQEFREKRKIEKEQNKEPSYVELDPNLVKFKEKKKEDK